MSSTKTKAEELAADPKQPTVTGSPDAIWLVYGELEHDDTHDNCARDGEVLWCEDPQFPADVKYVRADRLAGVEAERDRLAAEVEALRADAEPERRFPMQRGPSIPWTLAEAIYAGYSALYGTDQSLQRLAERGGFSWPEVEHIYNCRDKRSKAAIDAAIDASRGKG